MTTDGPLRVALLSYRSKPHCGGQGVYVRHLSRVLALLGHRVEVFSGGYLIFAPDWPPIVWTQAERARGQAWGLRLPESFHTYGTPNVDLAKVEVREIPVFDPL